MQHDPQRVEDARGWLMKASDDLRGGEIDLAASPPLVTDAMFHAQQAVEKVLKAFLAWHDVPFRKTHDLRELGSQCVEHDVSLQELCERAEVLSPFAWQFRYPGEPEAPMPEEGEEALALARETYGAILSRLPGEVSP